MDEKCSICANYYEVCPNCKKEWVKLKGCVEDSKHLKILGLQPQISKVFLE